jgi:poly-gamma-glutamate synthesis protein (capsule biosynthesis protein)
VGTSYGAGIKTAGAGWNAGDAFQPALFPIGGSRALIFAIATEDSGVPRRWAAGDTAGNRRGARPQLC